MNEELIRLADLFNVVEPEESQEAGDDEEEVRLADLFKIEEE